MSETKQGWCKDCDSEQTFYYDKMAQRWFCSICEKPLQEEQPAPPAAGAVETEGEQAPVQQVLINDLDHIRIQLSGNWSNEDLKNLADDLNLSAEGAKEGGLGLSFFAVKKSAAQQARTAGGIVVPFRDRHGKIIPGRALNLSPQSLTKKPGEPQSGSSGIILPGA
ncbi:MAG: hypothetical protein KGL39_34920 [Patescibacteria group bacterium]|nr:hypothetical protein [Patescibacteria group bacterium]